MVAPTLSQLQNNPAYTVKQTNGEYIVTKPTQYGDIESYRFNQQGQLITGNIYVLGQQNRKRALIKRFVYTGSGDTIKEDVYDIKRGNVSDYPIFLESNTLYGTGENIRTAASSKLTPTQKEYQKERNKTQAPVRTVENTAASRYMQKLKAPVSRADTFSPAAKKAFNIREGSFSDEIILFNQGKTTAASGLGIISTSSRTASFDTKIIPSLYTQPKKTIKISNREFQANQGLNSYNLLEGFTREDLSTKTNAKKPAKLSEYQRGKRAAELAITYNLTTENSRFKQLVGQRLKEESILAGKEAYTQRKVTKKIAGDIFDFTVEPAERQKGIKGFISNMESNIGREEFKLRETLKGKAPNFLKQLDNTIYNLDVYAAKRAREPTLKESFASFSETVATGKPSTVRFKKNTYRDIISKPDLYASQFSAGYISGIRDKPIQTAATTGAFFLLPAASKLLKKTVTIGSKLYVSPYYSGFVKQVAGATSATLALGYVTTIGIKTSIAPQPTRELGTIASTEIAPMIVGGVAGQKFWSFAETKFLKSQYKPTYFQPYKSTKQATFEGREPFPQVSRGKGSIAYRQVKDFETSPAGLPIEYKSRRLKIFKSDTNKAEFAWKTVGESWGSNINLQPSGQYELQGTYFSAYVSPNFLRLGNRVSLYPTGDFLVPYGSPRAIRQATLGFKGINLKDEAKINDFLTSGKAKQGYIYAFSSKLEQEGVMIGGTESNLIDVPYYTSIPSQRQIGKYETFIRQGQVEYVRRVPKFDIKKPSTYIDKIFGRKAGTIKKFGFEGVGKDVLIEVRGTAAQSEAASASGLIPKGTISKALGYGKSSSAVLSGSNYLSSPQSVVLGTAFSYSNPYTRKSSYTVLSRNISNYGSSRGYSGRSYGSGSSSSSSIYSPSRTSSGSSSSSSISSSISSASSPSSSSSTISGSSSSSTFSTTTTISKPSFIQKFKGIPTTKKRKERLVDFNPKYFASVEATALNIRGKKPSKLSLATGLNIRPIIRGM